MIIIAVIIQNLLASIYSIQTRIAAKTAPKQQWPITFWVFVFLILFGILIALFMGDIDWSTIYDPRLLLLFTLNGFFFGCGTGILFYSYRKIDTTIIQIISTIRIPLVALFSIFALNQSLNLLGVLGIIMVSLSVFLVVKPNKKVKVKLTKELIAAFIVPLMFATGIITEKITLESINVSTFLFYSLPFELLWVALALKLVSKASFKPSREVIRYAIPMGLVRIMGGFTFIWLLENVDNTSFVGAMSGLATIFTAFIAAIFLKETDRIRMIILSAVIGTIGIALVYI